MLCCVLVAGLCAPNGATGGYDRDGKQLVARYLRQVLSEASRRMAVRSSKIIAHARIPVLKLELRNGIELDVSINDTSGVSAANFLQSWVSAGVSWLLVSYQHTADLVYKSWVYLLVTICLPLYCVPAATRLCGAAATGGCAEEHLEAGRAW